MKKKGTQYILLLVVLGIWGMIGYRFFSYLAPEEEKQEEKAYAPQSLTLGRLKTEYSISCNYPDPFMKQERSSAPARWKAQPSSSSVVKDPKKKTAPKVIQPPANDFPSIQLAGVIANKQGGKKSAIVVLEGKEYSLAQGETLNGIRLAKIFSDSVLVTYQKKNKIIRL